MHLKGGVMEWLEPWCSTKGLDSRFHESQIKQLELEVPPGHGMFGLPVGLIGRGNGDDALFEILDGSNRVAVVHMTWNKNQEQLPWPITDIYDDIEAFVHERMVPEHREWADE
jgi:hypothetical protein